ncbi:F-box only protein 32 [Hetaerina americana]|uniref:F-box only protein 32 n=1 Tax=Hetaerina americana TaxID=62018 RepID=UPI003A7F0FF5
MPFISKDWRSPGEEWVKTEEGWEKKKILMCGRQRTSNMEDTNSRCQALQEFNQELRLSTIANRWLREEEEEDKENMITDTDSFTREYQSCDERQRVNDMSVQPHCHITIKCTREIAGFNGLSDALKRLDFRSAVRDVRRFNYICKLLDLLVSSQKVAALSGCAQKVLFNMLEEVAYQVSSSQQNIHLLRGLLSQLRLMREDCSSCWGRPLGSTTLWERHLSTINRILNIAARIQINEPGDDVFPKLQNLPEECVREILLRLADHRDLESSAGAGSEVIRNLVYGEQRLWRELAQFHFTNAQIATVLAVIESEDDEAEKAALESSSRSSVRFYGRVGNRIVKSNPRSSEPDWQRVYHKLRRSVGLREEYAEMLQLCRNCRCLFWKSSGHPCIIDQDPAFLEKLEDVDKDSLHVPIPPHAFLKFFSL